MALNTEMVFQTTNANLSLEDRDSLQNEKASGYLDQPHVTTSTHCRECINDDPVYEDNRNVPPIAVVGMAARLPGGVNCPEELWNFLVEKKHGVCEIPNTRYAIDSFYSDDKPHTVKTRHGYFLREDPTCFDASFFSITAAEAGRMDPQQRQLLEVVWECLESAGETNWRGRNIGCYVGVYGEDWLDLASKDPQHTDRYHILGTGQFALSNRVSFEYDFQGPRTFDEKADGYGRGEAINALYIKLLDDALRDNDPIRAIIRATSTNCDGRTPSITTPGSHSQEALIRRAYEKAGIKDITQTGFFECHGTGTVAGDKAELSVISKLFNGKGIVIGAVKPNVGHGEGASGITSVIKGVLSLEHNTIPPNIFFETPNPNVPFRESKLQVPLEAMPWPKHRAERVSVNCFGIGGANAHTVLDSATSFCGTATHVRAPDTEGPRLLVVSAHTTGSLQERISRVVEYSNQHPAMLHDLAYTLGLRREHLPYRAFVIARPGTNIIPSAFQTGQDKSPELTLVLTGQGAQWAAMGKDLIHSFAEFKATIQALDKALGELENAPSWLIEDELSKQGTDSRVNEAEFSQPLTTALQVGLIDLLSKRGIKASSVIGHSSGEIAAAYAAGAITARSAIIIAYYRGQVAKIHEGKGAMAAVGLSCEEVTAYLGEGVVIACENSPKGVTLSGDKGNVEGIVRRIQAELPDTLCRQLRVSIAYHSPDHMEDIGPVYESYISPHLETNETMIPMYSTVTNTMITQPSKLNAQYWRRNLESPVLFYPALQTIFRNKEEGNRAFLEIGPHSTLYGPLREAFQVIGPKTEPVYMSTLTRNDHDSTFQLLATLGHAHVYGISIDFQEVNGVGKTLPNLPLYPWQHDTTYWHESRLTREWRFRCHPHHELLGSRVIESSDLEPAWRNLLRVEDVPWLRDHTLQGDTIFPGTGYIAMAGEAIRQLYPEYEDYTVKNLIIKSPLLLQDIEPAEIVTTFKPTRLNDLVDSEWYDFTIVSHDPSGWTKHCQGQIRSHWAHEPRGCEIKRYSRVLEAERYYQSMERLGFTYGPHFGRLQDITVHTVDRECSASIFELDQRSASRYTMHPAVMDCCIQLFPAAWANGIPRRLRLLIPAAIGQIYVGGSAPQMTMQACIRDDGSGSMLGHAVMMAGDQSLLSITDILGFPVDNADGPTKSHLPLASQVIWAPDIDFLCPLTLLPKTTPQKRYCSLMKCAGMLAYLYVLQTDDKLNRVTAPSSSLARWKDWVGKEAAKIRAGTGLVYPESHAWAQMSSAQRCIIMRNIRERYGPQGDDDNDDDKLFILFECLDLILEKCVDFMADETVAHDVLTDQRRMEGLYAALQSQCNWTKFLPILCHSNPALRVLEIGAGTGSATREVLKHLKSAENRRLYSNYTFTDLSQQMLDIAQKTFQLEENINYQLLDISDDPQIQGFEPHFFDLIIASNVLHRTPCLVESLRNIRQLLAPNGRLLLHDLSSDLLVHDYIFGILPDWWVGDTDQRADKPYVTPERWDSELRAAGFIGNEVTTYDIDQPYQSHFTMLSRDAKTWERKSNIFLLTDSTPTGKAQDFAHVFRSHGYTIDWCTIHHPPPGDHFIISLLDLDGPYLYNMSESDYSSLQSFLTKVESNQILWVTRTAQMACTDARFGLIFGFARTLRQERSLDFCVFETDVFSQAAIDVLVQVYEKLQWSRQFPDTDQEYEFSFYQGILHIGRCHWVSPSHLLPPKAASDGPYKLAIQSPANMDSLYWAPDDSERPLQEHDVEIDIHYVGLNFRDILVAMGLFGNADEFGLEGSGIVRRVGSDRVRLRPGDKVAVLIPGVCRTRIVIHSQFCIMVPDHISLEDAATMPSVYITAIYSLDHLARLQKDESVLIHSACGGVGLAAIRVSQIIGAESQIYATVGSEEKVQFLVDNFNIPRNRIFNSRNAGFLPSIMKETNGRGVDVVLNSLSGDLLHASWECVASFGRMVELGKRDFLGNGQLNMKPFMKNRAYFGFDLTQVREVPETSARYVIKRVLVFQVNWLIQNQIAQRIRILVLDAFRYMQQGVHIGKILIKMPDDPCVLANPIAKSHFSLSPNASYLLVGGLGGLGRSISTWMVERGARHLTYLSPSAGQKHHSFIQELEEQGCHVSCVSGSVERMKDVERAASQCTRPLAGVLQMSAVLKDRMFKDMSYNEWISCLAPKVSGTWNLHTALEKTNLDFFVVFSSVSGTCGNPGQANYAAANTFLNSFTKYRRQLGMPSSVLDLGAVEEVGLMNQDPRVLENARTASVRLVLEAELMEGLQLAISQSPATESPGALVSSPCIIGLGNSRPLSDPGVRTMWAKDVRFSFYRNLQSQDTCQFNTASEELRILLRRVERNPALLDDPETEAVLRCELIKQVRQRMPQTQDMSEDEIADMAIDSLMAIEIKTWVHSNLGLNISLAEIGKAGSAGALAKSAIEHLKAKYQEEGEQGREEGKGDKDRKSES
ncbi:hypothetical protein ETB97_008996 [Aspergillus alliaceus]|uniref:Carrier domain-containing protein n=1 Tax=Petromyces alliaceus TaxID=209559 RepID=A0A8H6E1T8_PETAA|nr:hypothetical protein ETB97_008996 [Aspergillus burnettii]